MSTPKNPSRRVHPTGVRSLWWVEPSRVANMTDSEYAALVAYRLALWLATLLTFAAIVTTT